MTRGDRRNQHQALNAASRNLCNEKDDAERRR
jgi:hypothetical protein